MTELKVGDRLSWKRPITKADIERFTEVSKDANRYHTEPDAQGRLIAHGLLTATIPTKLGGDIGFFAREMRFKFRKPVYSGDVLACDCRVELIEKKERFTKSAFSFKVTNQRGELVMTGKASGLLGV